MDVNHVMWYFVAKCLTDWNVDPCHEMSPVSPAALAAVSLETENNTSDKDVQHAHKTTQMTHVRKLMYIHWIHIHSLVVGMSHKNLSWFSWEYSYVLIPTCCGQVFIVKCVFMLNDPKLHTHLFVDWGWAPVSPCGALWLWVGPERVSDLQKSLEIQIDDRNVVRLAEVIAKESRQLYHLDCKPQFEVSDDCTKSLTDLK